MTQQDNAPAANEPGEGTPPDARTGSTETVTEQNEHAQGTNTQSVMESVGADEYGMYMAQALSTDFWGMKAHEMSVSDLYVLIGALNADRLSMGRELDIALQQLANPATSQH